MALCVAAEPVRWEVMRNLRSRDVPVSSAGRPGFVLTAPSMTGIAFSNVLSDARAAENQIRLNGSGVAAADVDGDGWCDLYFCGLENGNRLYRNLGGWRFADITDRAGVACTNQFSTGAVFSDLDGDGDLDLLVNSIGGGTRCFLNDGTGHFAENSSAGLFRKFGATSMALADINGDGALDLYVANYRTTTIRSTGFAYLNIAGQRSIRPEDRDRLEYTAEGLVLEHGEPDVIYLNDRAGHFRALSWTQANFLDEKGQALSAPPRDWGLSVMFRDINGDGTPDVYVCNDFHSPDRIWINDGTGRFRAIGELAIRDTSTFSMSVDFADINRDGVDDVFVADMLDPRRSFRLAQTMAQDRMPSRIGLIGERMQVDRNTVQLNRGDGSYAEIAYYGGLEASGWTWSALFLDVDLDGFEDILMTTGQMFNTQDLDANAHIEANGPYPKEMIPRKLLMHPRLPLSKRVFRNMGNLRFEETSAKWGFNQDGVSHGMCLADLDNDGDLDVIVNNLNGVAGVYRNESSAARVAVRLKGLPPNTQGIGARITLFGGATAPQSQEVICGGRYLSGDDPMRVFAAGSMTNEMRIEVKWRSGRKSAVEGIKPNRIYEIAEDPDLRVEPPKSNSPPAPLFEEVSGLLDHRHQEADFNDFDRQRLLPNKLSQLGPGISWIDLDGDGWEDLVIGSGKGGRMAMYRNSGLGSFQRPDSFAPVTRDQTGVLGWPKSNGTVTILAGSANYEDGLAAGGCVREYEGGTRVVTEGFPGQRSSSGALALSDVRGDGELELFVAGRVIAGRYPEAASSALFKNRQGGWVPDGENTKTLEQVGLVSGAVWTDLDGDGYPELVLACEWGPVKVLKNERGSLRDATRDWGLGEYAGWWNGVSAGDFDGDGRMDLVASNWGLNTKYRAGRSSPRRLYYGELEGGGKLDVIESTFDPELKKWVPERDLKSMVEALPLVAEKFQLHREYASAGLEDIFGEGMDKTKFLEANWLETTLFLNRGDHFELGKLPSESQFSPAFGVNVGDADGDGNEDIFLSQNFFATQPQTSRSDAGRGLWLRGDGKGRFLALQSQESGIKIDGEQRGSALCDYDHDGRVDLVVTQNGAQTRLYHNRGGKRGLRVRLHGTAGNPDGIGAVIRLKFGGEWGAAREAHGGSGYWSQDSPVQVMGTPEMPAEIQIRWPGGKTTTAGIPRGAKSVTVDFQGSVKVDDYE